MKIYLDNCCYNRPFDDQSQIKIHLDKIVSPIVFVNEMEESI